MINIGQSDISAAVVSMHQQGSYRNQTPPQSCPPPAESVLIMPFCVINLWPLCVNLTSTKPKVQQKP